MSELVMPIATMLFGITAIGGMYLFGLRIYADRLDSWSREWDRWFDSLSRLYEKTQRMPMFDWKYVWDAWDDALRRRNKFWELFGQVALSVVVSVIVAVLLLTKTIEADAGLPILSAIVAFVVGKGIGGQGRGSSGPPPE